MKYNDSYWQDVERVLPHIKNLSALKNKSVLITGGTGLICSGVVDILHYLNKKENAKTKMCFITEAISER